MFKLSLLFLMSSILMVMTQHPLIMAMILLINTMIASLTTGMMNLNYWYSFMVFMIMIGGMLVLIMYMYMTTVAANEMLENTLNFTPIIIMMFLIATMMKLDFMEMNTSNNTFDTSSFSMKHNLSLSKYLSYSHLPILLMLINYLLITLIAIVKITSPKYGSLRQKI